MFTEPPSDDLSPLEEELWWMLRASDPGPEGHPFTLSLGYHNGRDRASDRVHPYLRELESRPLSGALADELDELEPDSLNERERAIVLDLRVRLRRRAEFQEMESARRLVNDEHLTETQRDAMVPEFAFLYRIHHNTAAARVAEARETARLPKLMERLQHGEVDVTQVRVAATESMPIRDEAAATFDERVAERAPQLSLGETRALAEKVAKEVDAEHAREHAKNTRKSSDVKVVRHASGDGADLIATGCAADIAEIIAAINTRAGLDEKDDSFTAGARRFHALKSLVVGGLEGPLACDHCGQVIHDKERGSRRRRARNRVVVTIPYRTLCGDSDAPGDLEGYGPIDATEARRFAAQPGTTFQRLFYDPVNGVAKDFDPTRYRLTPDEADLLGFRDGTCMAPGCGRPASMCDADHLFDFGAGGATALNNLGSLCNFSHGDKTREGIVTEQKPDGTGQSWTTPLGRHYEKDFRDHRPGDQTPGEPHGPPPDEPQV
jgi:hypothetical protein